MVAMITTLTRAPTDSHIWVVKAGCCEIPNVRDRSGKTIEDGTNLNRRSVI